MKLFCALAAQCFINEYVFNHGDEEIRQVNQLRLLLQQLADRAKYRRPCWLQSQPIPVAFDHHGSIAIDP